MGNLVAVIDPAGNVSSFTHNSLGQRLSSTEPNSGSWTYEFDGAGRVIAQTDAKGQRTAYEFDVLGRRTKQTSLAGTAEAEAISWGYDEHRSGYANKGRRTSMTDAAGTVVYNFDGAGRLVHSMRTSPGVYRPQPAQVSETQTQGNVTHGHELTFQFVDLPKPVADGVVRIGVIGNFAIHSRGALVKIDGGPPKRTHRRHSTPKIVNCGRPPGTYGPRKFAVREIPLSAVDVADGVVTVTVELDAVYECKYGVKPQVQVELAYDAYNETHEFTKGYDASGRLLWTKYPDGDMVGSPSTPLQYDGAGRLESIPGIVASARYTAAGELVEQVNDNGTVTNFTLSREREWITAIKTSHGGTSIQDLVYERNAEGLITSLHDQRTGDKWRYYYDALHRLTQANTNTPGSETITYTDDGNISARRNAHLSAFTYGPAGGVRPHAVRTAHWQHSGGGHHTYDYDANGNMVSGAGRTFTWNGNNQLATVNDMTFVYDGDGTRIKKTEAGSTTVYLGDYEIHGDTVTKYVHFAGALVAKRLGIGGEETQWIHTNHLGSTEAITDADGVVIHNKTYRLFGDVMNESGVEAGRGYTGQRADASGLIYLGARYYDPKLGRFISPDPVVPSASSTGLNRYAYAGNNPVNFTDTDGLSWLSKARRKFRRKVKKVFKKVVREVRRFRNRVIADRLKVPLVGGVLAAPFQFHRAVEAGDAKQAARIAGTAMVMAAAAVLTTFTGGLAAPLYVAANAAIGFGSGFATAKINGASTSDALKAGAISAAISAGTAALAKMNEAMRARVIRESGKQNLGGPSRGFSLNGRGDGVKAAGGRLLSDGTRGPRSPLGWYQNDVGGIGPFGPYSPGGAFDRVVEAYAGPHDWLNGAWGSYGPNGNLSATYGLTQKIGNWVNVPLATPIALAGLSQSVGATPLVIGDLTRVHGAQTDAQRTSSSTFMAAGAH